MTPLWATYGDRLTILRDGNAVRWVYDGRSAVVALRGDVVEATFVDRPALDAVSASPAAPVYRGSEYGYALTPAGCSRMVADMVAFFEGTREPRFTFVGAV